LRLSELQLKAEADALAKLNDLSCRLWTAATLKAGLEQSLDAVMEVLSAEKGTVQLLDSARGVLTIDAHRGFKKEFLDLFAEVTAGDECANGRSLRTGERIVIADTETDVSFAPHREAARAAGYRAVVSTPLSDDDGRVLGVFSAYFGHAHSPTQESLRMLDLYVRQAARFVRRCRAEAAQHQAATH
jgi:GAF domain-containing protein